MKDAPEGPNTKDRGHEIWPSGELWTSNTAESRAFLLFLSLEAEIASLTALITVHFTPLPHASSL